MERRDRDLEEKGKRIDSLPTNDEVTVEESSEEKGEKNQSSTGKGFLEYEERSWYDYHLYLSPWSDHSP
jgi:hypothetical protein